MFKLILRLAIGISVFLVLILVLVISVTIGGTAASASCVPSASDVLSGISKVGSGPASNAYFAQFGSQIAAQKKANALTLIKAGQARKEKTHTIEAIVGAALDESGLLNLTGGDRDSLGILQQRPSAGSWGTAAQIMNITHAANAFYDHADKVPNADSLSLIGLAEAVQIPNLADYEQSWSEYGWAKIATEIVTGADDTSSCNDASGTAHLPLLPGYSVSATFDDTAANYYGIKPHSGIDLTNYADGSLGKPVFAARAGTVVASGIGNGCTPSNNNTVIIQHDDGLETVYMHMNGSKITVHVGDVVKAGQQIGAIGSCGQSTGPHLHFAVEVGSSKAAWVNSLLHINQFGVTWVDPVGYMAHYGITLVPNK